VTLFSWWGNQEMVYYFGRKGSHYLGYEFVPPSDIYINQDAIPKIVDAPLTLGWRSFSEWGSDCVTSFFAYKGWQYDDYVYSRPNSIVITLLTWPKFVDTLLTLIFRMEQWPFRFLFCLQRLVIRWIWVYATILDRNYLTYMTKICWCSVDPHFQNGAVTISLSFLPIKDGNTMVMWISDQIDL